MVSVQEQRYVSFYLHAVPAFLEAGWLHGPQC